ncbi:MAG: membrane protein insertion efficiency factor YidD [Candidatus Doudnabacteria bacterium]|nr:membrane protein insertion efficiency factor YidD [Candidatus Doudnabacteria bacterium]
MSQLLNKIKYFPRYIVVFLIKIYQLTLSPDHGMFKSRHPHGFCRFYPTCSEYTKESVLKYGVLRGLYFALPRLIKCNPYTSPRVDLVK